MYADGPGPGREHNLTLENTSESVTGRIIVCSGGGGCGGGGGGGGGGIGGGGGGDGRGDGDGGVCRRARARTLPWRIPVCQSGEG